MSFLLYEDIIIILIWGTKCSLKTDCKNLRYSSKTFSKLDSSNYFKGNMNLRFIINKFNLQSFYNVIWFPRGYKRNQRKVDHFQIKSSLKFSKILVQMKYFNNTTSVRNQKNQQAVPKTFNDTKTKSHPPKRETIEG